MIRETFDEMIMKGEYLNSERCVNYAKMALTAWNKGKDQDAYAYLDKARYELDLVIDELPF